MALFGLNNTIDVIRKTAGSPDSVGGATEVEAVVYTGVKCRVSNSSGSRREQALGIDFARAIKVSVWPASYFIYPNDVVVVGEGNFAGQRFLVRDVQVDSQGPLHPRSHISLTCERVDQRTAGAQ